MRIRLSTGWTLLAAGCALAGGLASVQALASPEEPEQRSSRSVKAEAPIAGGEGDERDASTERAVPIPDLGSEDRLERLRSSADDTDAAKGEVAPPIPGEVAPFVRKAIVWLAEAQHENGGWGAGSHARQQIRDPHAVQVDPATTAFAAMALVRAGHTPVSGDHRATVRRATERLVRIVEDAPEEGAKITDLTSTQPQQKLGPLIDTTMTTMFLSRVLETLPVDDPLHAQVDRALEKCLRKLQGAQKANGSWGGRGWAPVLQDSFGCSALEIARAVGKRVDPEAIQKARDYQKGNFDERTGRAASPAGAGIELYSFAGSQRAAAGEAKDAKEIVERAKEEGRIEEDAEVNEDNLAKLGLDRRQAVRYADAFAKSQAQLARLDDDALLSGFGSNGGEEYLSYLLTSESLVIAGGEEWTRWNRKMHERLSRIQSPGGSWTGHHCITSPVFCTAAVVQCLTADRDAKLLARVSDVGAPETDASGAATVDAGASETAEG